MRRPPAGSKARAGGREDALAELIAYHFREAATLTSATESRAARRGRDPAKGGGLAQARGRRRGGRRRDRRGRPAPARGHRAGARPTIFRSSRSVSVTCPGETPGRRRTGSRFGSAGSLGRPADQELRILGSLLTRYMRFQGTVGNRPSAEEIQRLRADGRALARRARDERAIASFLIADGFYPFWRGAQTTAADIAEAEASTGRGLAIADRLDDPRLRSAALDALTCCAQARGAWAQARQFCPGASRLRGPPRSPRATRRPHDGGVGVGPAGRPRPGGPRDRLGSGPVSIRTGALVGAPLRRLASVRPDAPRAVGRGARRRRARAQDLGRGRAHPGGVLRPRLHRRPGRRPGRVTTASSSTSTARCSTRS